MNRAHDRDIITRIETFTPSEVARRLGLDRSTISRKIKAEDIETIRVGAHHCITSRALERFRDGLAPDPLFTYREFARIVSGGEDYRLWSLSACDAFSRRFSCRTAW